MFVLYDDKPDIRVGKVQSTSMGFLQVQNLHGKQQKIKDKSVLLSWEGDLTTAESLISQATLLAQECDPQFLWESAPEGEFSYVRFAEEYFGTNATIVEKTALLLFLREQSIFFRRGQGELFRKAPADQVNAALAGAERRKAQEQATERLTSTLMQHQLPDGWASTWTSILNNKQSQPTPEQKALATAAKKAGVTPEVLLKNCGAFSDWEDFHIQQFLFVDFPDHSDFSDVITPEHINPVWDSLPESTLTGTVFSIDDASTDEIDDALSVEEFSGGYRIGIHISAPSLLWDGESLDINLAVKRFSQRLSTVYHPSGKIPMMGNRHGQSWGDAFSLDAGKSVPVVSLFINVDSAMTPMSHETRVHRLLITHNLRLQEVEAPFNQAALQAKTQSGGVNPTTLKLPQNFPEALAMDRLWKFALQRETERIANGASAQFHSTEYRFEVRDGEVIVSKRPRGAPMDELVAELMIYANAYWSQVLKQASIPAIYRVKDDSKVGFTTTPGRHTSMGLNCYGWFTSPLRRMVDFCNQRQLIQHALGKTALLRAWPVGENPPVNHTLPWSTINLEDLAQRANALHGIYGDFQDRMERFWCLRWLEQESQRRLDSNIPAVFPVVLQRQMRYPHLVFNDIPLTAKLAPDAMDKLIASTDSEINVKVSSIDYWALTVSLTRA